MPNVQIRTEGRRFGKQLRLFKDIACNFILHKNNVKGVVKKTALKEPRFPVFEKSRLFFMPDRKNNYFGRILGTANTAAQKLRFCRVENVENILNLCRFFYCKLFQVEFMKIKTTANHRNF